MNFARQASQIGISNACLLDLTSGKITGNSGTIILESNLLDKIAFIKEGEFVEEKGKPALRLIGDIQEISTGKIVVKETTKRVVKAIETNDILDAFFNNKLVDEPLEYIKSICYATSANYPLYFLIKQSNLNISEIIDLIEKITVRGTTKKSLINRLSGNMVKQKSVSLQNTKTANEKRKYRDCWINENLITPIENISYCVDVLFALSTEEIVSHEKYIKMMLQHIFNEYYEKANSVLASNIRKAICRVDEAVYLQV